MGTHEEGVFVSPPRVSARPDAQDLEPAMRTGDDERRTASMRDRAHTDEEPDRTES